jgi:hypothetical protein
MARLELQWELVCLAVGHPQRGRDSGD